MFVEAMVGFDAREMQTRFAETWSSQRRALYLLRTDLDKPLSTDDMVWEPIFRWANTEIPDWAYFRSVRLELPQWTGPRQATWENLEQMQSFLGEYQPDWMAYRTGQSPSPNASALKRRRLGIPSSRRLLRPNGRCWDMMFRIISSSAA